MSESVQALQEKLAYEQRLVAVVDRIHAAKSLESIFVDVQGDLLALLDAERMTLYAIDHEHRELYSRLLAPGPIPEVREIRVPISEKSIAGFVALARRVVNVVDAYDAAELKRIAPLLKFDSSWDQKTGFLTRQVLAVPIMHELRVVGVVQLLNKKRGPRFTKEDEASVARITRTLGVAFNTQNQLAQKRPGKFDYLLAQHVITPGELTQATAEARQRQTDVETLLLENYAVPKSELGTALSQFYHCPFVEFDERVLPPADVMKDLKIDYLKKALWVPLRRDGDALIVLIDNPQDVQKVDTINNLLRGHKVSFAVGLRNDIVAFLGGLTGEVVTDNIGTILGDLKGQDLPEGGEEAADTELSENDSAIIRLANQMIVDAFRARASDIHVEPYGAERDTMIRIRVDGSCLEYQKIPGAYRRAIVARLKIMAQLDIAERRKPQDGKIRFKLPDREIELRVATVPTAGGNEDVVMRLLASNEPIPLDRLGLTERNLRGLRAIAEKPYGLILCVGPTGSGKTTTLHSVLGHINKPERKIWTARGPRRDHPARPPPGAGESQDRLHVRQRHAGLPARGPRRHHGGRDARRGDGTHGHRGVAHRPSRLLDAPHQQRGGDRRASPRHGARSLQLRRRAARGPRAATRQAHLRAVPGVLPSRAHGVRGAGRRVRPGGVRGPRSSIHRRLRADSRQGLCGVQSHGVPRPRGHS